MTDFLLLRDICRLVGSENRPRLIHKKGVCAGGYFRPYMSFSDYTNAGILASPEKTSDVIVRFSSMIGGSGTADTRRNIKGMSVKFLSEKECYDLICQSIPVFFIDEAKKFPNLYRALEGDKQKERLWKFAVDNPECINCLIRYYSYPGLCKSYIDIMMHSVNTYVWRNDKGKAHLVRYKWVSIADSIIDNNEESKRIKSVFAEFMAGFDPDIATDELRAHIDEGKFPQYELRVQLIDYEYIKDDGWIKKTICWSEKKVRSFPVGIMKLTTYWGDYGEKQRDLHFSPSNLIEGIELCGDNFSDIMAAAHNMAGEIRGVIK